MNNEYSLYHFGVKGMKWGHRKTHTRDKYVHGKKVASKGDPAKGGIFGVKTTLTKEKISSNSSKKSIGKKVAIAALAAWGATVTYNTIKDYRNGDPSTRFAIDLIKDIFTKK